MSAVYCRTDDGVLSVSFDSLFSGRPADNTLHDICAVMRGAATDVSIRAILIHGLDCDLITFERLQAVSEIDTGGFTELASTLECSEKPVVAALRGPVYGLALELALAAHYRIASDDAVLAQPDVWFGLMPFAGGTQRMPRLAGAKAAAEIMLSGQPVRAREVMELGLVDQVVPADGLGEKAQDWASSLAKSGAGPRRSRDATGLTDVRANLEALTAMRKAFAGKSRGQVAPQKILDALTAAVEAESFDAGIQTEQEGFRACADSWQRSAMTHAFLAERAVRQIPEACRGNPRKVKEVAVIGGGTMGVGITVTMLDAGFQVTMVERDAQSALRGRQNVEKIYNRLVAYGRKSEEQKSATMSRLVSATGFTTLAEVDLVVEAVFEDMSVKKRVFSELDGVCKPGTILATNTSFLDVDEIAASISRPEDVIGLHFFSPANVMKLLEIVIPRRVSDDVVATGFTVADQLGKVSIRAGVCDGFIGNRILFVYREAASFMLEDGASPYQIDDALEAFGYAMGPYRTADLTGGDISWAARKRKAATRDPSARYVRIADLLCERGWFGQKTGRGFYRYPDGARVGQPDEEVLALIDTERASRGIRTRAFTDDQIVRRYLAALINEAANVLQDGIALRPLDIDVAMVHGYGFPRWRGGPMYFADTVGLDLLLADIRGYEKEDPVFWKPSTLLVDLVAKGGKFNDLNGRYKNA